jgi:hypothetical protein
MSSTLEWFQWDVDAKTPVSGMVADHAYGGFRAFVTNVRTSGTYLDDFSRQMACIFDGTE